MTLDHIKKMKTKINSKREFDDILASSRLPIFAEFYTNWCGPCKMIQPIFDELKSEFAGKLLFIEIDVEKVKDVSDEMKVFSLPTLILFNHGKIIDRITGFKEKNRLEKWLNKNLRKIYE